MAKKLVRNKSDERSRAFWDAVHAAASSAPRLKFPEEKDTVTRGRSGRTKDADASPKKDSRTREKR